MGRLNGGVCTNFPVTFVLGQIGEICKRTRKSKLHKFPTFQTLTRKEGFYMYKPLITDGTTKFGNNRWLSYSSKLKRDVFLFSDLEYEHWILIESNPKIVEFCEQARVMETFINGKLQTSIIDMWVKYSASARF